MNWIEVLPEAELPEGARQVVEVEGHRIFLLHHQGEVYAMLSRCPHMRGPLARGEVTEEGAIVCPWHHSAFDLRTGAVKAWAPWPPVVGRLLGAVSRERPLRTFPTRVEGGSIWLGLDDAQ